MANKKSEELTENKLLDQVKYPEDIRHFSLDEGDSQFPPV